MNIISLDLGKFNSMVCFFDPQIRKQRTQMVKTDRSYMRSVLMNNPCDLVVVEACSNSGWVHDLCQELNIPALVCSTREDAWRWRNVKSKTDKDDAVKLARLAWSNELKPTHVPTTEMREYRGLIHHRKKLVGRENQLKNSIRSLFAGRGIELTRGKQTSFSKREFLEQHRKRLLECEMKELWCGELDQYLTAQDQISLLLKTVERKLDAIAKHDDRVQRVMQIDGVGRVTAEAIVCAIDDAKRFKNGRQVSAYAGLVPRQFQSGETDRRGRITKRGPRLLRTLLLECAWISLRYNEWSRVTYERIHGGKQLRKKKAAIALARKIPVVAWAMLRDETDYDPERLLPQEPKAA